MLLTMCLSAPLTVSAATVSVTVNNSGTVYTVNATVGEELAAPTERANGMSFLGWYSDPECTEEYGVVQENETRKAYAKYPSTYIPFNEKEYEVGSTIRDNSGSYSGAYVSSVVIDPDDADNKVFKLHSNDLYATVMLPLYDDADAAKYQLVEGHSYTISFKYKIPDSLTVSTVGLRITQGDSCASSGAKRKALDSETKKTITVSDLTVGQWYTYTAYFTPTATSTYTSPMISLYCEGTASAAFGAANYAYFDDVVITDNDAEYDIEIDNTYTSFEGCTVNYDGGFSSSTSASISTEAAHSGDSSLKIAPSGANKYRSYAYNAPSSALKLDSYTKYTISYWYMATAVAGSYTNIFTTLNGSGNVWDTNTQLDETSIHDSALNEWHKVEFTVISGDCSSQAYLTFGLHTAAAGTVVYIDDVSVTAVEYIGMHDYYCDFSADFSFYKTLKSNGDWPYYSSNVNFNTDDGVLYFPSTHTGTPSLSSAGWIQHFAPYDGNGYYQFEANTSYRVVVRYKQTAATDTNTGYFSIGTKTTIPKSETIKSLVINNLVGDTEWKEYTFDFVTDDLSSGQYLTLTFGSKDGSLVEYEVDYVKVTKGPFINNNGVISKNTTAAGYEIATPAYDTDKYSFIGWYSDPGCTQPFGVVRENETRTAYARYNKTVITFSEAEFTRKVTYRDDSEDYGGYESGIVLDPTNATNKVFKLHNPNIWSNFVIPVYDAKGVAGYPLIDSVEYTVTVDFMIPETVTAETLDIRMITGPLSEDGIGRMTYEATSEVYNISELEAGKWYTYTATFTVAAGTSASYPYPLIRFQYDGNGASATTEFAVNNYVYFDNVTVYNAAQFVDVTLNNRGSVSTVETIVGAELPAVNSNLDEQVFLGWYSDPECTTEYGTVQADETRTAYAKYDVTKITFGSGNKQLNAGDTYSVPCYDGVENTLNLEAGKTYAMRFIYKQLEGSAAGKLSVLGNELTFDAYDADNANVWTPAAITFTATEATALQLSLTSDGNSSLYIDDLLVYNVDYTPEATVTAGNSTITVTNPVAQNNMQTGSVTVELADGEQLKANGITITYNLYATAFSEEIESRVILSEGAYDLDKDQVDGNGNKFLYFVPANAKNIKISAEFVSSDETNLDIIAASIRPKTDTLTSGLRFRGRVYNDANITKVGFLLAPEKLVVAAGYETLTLENADECKAVIGDATGVVYDKTDLYTDYQVVLTKIDSILDTSIQCVLYVEYSDGTVTYADAKTQSHEGIKSAMNVQYRGLPATYFSEEYEDTRNKLLQTQNDGAFSFLLLTDIHIDYVKTVLEGEYWYTTPVGETLPDRPNIQNEIAMVIEIANTTDVDCIILGGDLIHGTNSHASSMADLNYLAQVFQKAKVPVLASRGNHDRNDYHGTPCALTNIITNEEWSTTLIDPLAKDAVAVHDDATDQYSSYYYMDFPEKKTRVIVLDAWNYPILTTDGVYSVYRVDSGWSMYGDNAQVEWLAKVALDAELQGWNYVLSSHAPIVGDESGSSTNAKTIRSIIEAFNNKTTVDVFGTTMDYSNYDGQMPLNVSGHTHIQSWRTLGDTLVAVNTGSGRFAYYPTEILFDSATGKEYQPVRWEGTYSQACFDAIVYDPAISTVQRFNFGNRPDNKFVITDSGIVITETPHEGEYAE